MSTSSMEFEEYQHGDTGGFSLDHQDLSRFKHILRLELVELRNQIQQDLRHELQSPPRRESNLLSPKTPTHTLELPGMMSQDTLRHAAFELPSPGSVINVPVPQGAPATMAVSKHDPIASIPSSKLGEQKTPDRIRASSTPLGHLAKTPWGIESSASPLKMISTASLKQEKTRDRSVKWANQSTEDISRSKHGESKWANQNMEVVTKQLSTKTSSQAHVRPAPKNKHSTDYRSARALQADIRYKKAMTRKALRQTLKVKENTWTEKFSDWLIEFFEGGILFFIAVNSIVIGVQTDYQARNVTEHVPWPFKVLEVIFCIVFTSELAVKLAVYKRQFWTMPGRAWNIFDTLLVVMQLIEVIGIATSSHESSQQDSNMGGVNVSFLRMLRVLRIFRVFRVIRLVEFIAELATIFNAIANSFRALCWTLVLLLMMMYVVGTVYTQIVFSHRLDRKIAEEEATPELAELELWWGSLPRAVLSLYQSIMGGIDWETVVSPLEKEISILLSVLFCLYIAFALLAFMNIITGTFVQSALSHAENEKNADFSMAAQEAFMTSGRGSKGNMPLGSISSAEVRNISYQEFAETIDTEPFSRWIASMNIDPQDAKLLFQLLDTENTGIVDAETLVNGLIRLRQSATFMDILKVMYETSRQTNTIDDLCRKTWKVTGSQSVDAHGFSDDLARMASDNSLVNFQRESMMSAARSSINSDWLVHPSDNRRHDADKVSSTRATARGSLEVDEM